MYKIYNIFTEEELDMMITFEELEKYTKRRIRLDNQLRNTFLRKMVNEIFYGKEDKSMPQEVARESRAGAIQSSLNRLSQNIARLNDVMSELRGDPVDKKVVGPDSTVPPIQKLVCDLPEMLVSEAETLGKLAAELRDIFL